MIEILQYGFMQRAIIGGILVAITCSLLGTFLILRKMALLGDGLAHASFAGIAAGLLAGIYPLYTALIVSVISALGIQKLTEKIKIYGDSAIAVVLSFGMALALIMISLAKKFNTELFTYLFGSILTISSRDLQIIFLVTILTSIFTIFFYRSLFYMAFNENIAKVRGIRVNLLSSIYLILTAMAIVIAIRAVGLLLLTALLVIPSLSAMRIARSFRATLLISALISTIGVIIGITSSYYLNLPTGACIVMSLCLIFMISVIYREIKK